MKCQSTHTILYNNSYFAQTSAIDASKRVHNIDNATSSWVSGHAALSIAGILYMSLVLWHDVSQWPVTLARRRLMPLYVSAAYFTLM
jgi:hypothetical protein